MSTEVKTRKKLLFVVTLAELGGAQKYVRELAAALKESFDITIAASTADRRLLDWAEERGIKIFPLKNLDRELAFGFLPTGNDFRTFLDLYRHLRAEPYEIVHLSSSKIGLIGALASRMAEIPKVVFTAHGWVFNEPSSIRPKKRLWIWVSRLAALFQDYIICLSGYDFDQALRYRIAPPRKMIVIPNGIDAAKIAYLPRAKPRAELEEKVGGGANTIIAGTIANFYPTKDLGTMIEAIGRLDNPNLKLVIIGDGQEREKLESQIANRKLASRVFLPGQIENAIQYLKAFDIYLISSLKEGHPFSALEAMAAGLPIVSTPVGGLRELLFPEPEKNNYALEFKPGDAEGLARDVERIAADKELAALLGKNARGRVSSLFSLGPMVEKTRWVYELD